MSAPRHAWVAIVTSPFGRALAVSGALAWVFVHGVALELEVPPDSAVSTAWVLGATLVLLAVELRRRRLQSLFATLGVSAAAFWGFSLVVVGILEVVVWLTWSAVPGS